MVEPVRQVGIGTLPGSYKQLIKGRGIGLNLFDIAKNISDLPNPTQEEVENMEIKEIKLGMRVRFTGDDDDDLKNLTGTVVDDTGNQAGVEWDKRFGHMHDCSGLCKPKHGWYVYKYSLTPLNEEDTDMTSTPTQSTLKLEDLEHALPLLGLRVMIHPDKAQHYDSRFANQTGTITSLEGDNYDVKNVINRYKRGNRDISWKVEVKFDNGLSDVVRIMHMIPVGTAHIDIYQVDISGLGKVAWTKEQYDEKINEYIIVKGRKLRSKSIITNVDRQLTLDQA